MREFVFRARSRVRVRRERDVAGTSCDATTSASSPARCKSVPGRPRVVIRSRTRNKVIIPAHCWQTTGGDDETVC